MPKIKVIRETVVEVTVPIKETKTKAGIAKGKQVVPAGAVVETTEKDAHVLIGMGKAKPYSAPKKAKKEEGEENKGIDSEDLETK
jgi:hypothetical protein